MALPTQQLPQSGHRPTQPSVWLWLMTLVCASLLLCASTAQACHAHDGLLRSADGRSQLSAPADECPLCAAPHAALPADAEVAVVGTLQVETLQTGVSATSRKTQWTFDLFSRPPPTALRSSAMVVAGFAMAS